MHKKMQIIRKKALGFMVFLREYIKVFLYISLFDGYLTIKMTIYHLPRILGALK
jgi:hypothetical protein